MTPDPFAPMPDTSEGLTNTSSDLRALLENGALEGACEAFEADPQNRQKKLLCGKYMFFYEGFGTIGVPAAIFDFMVENFTAEIGPGFSNYGLIADPFSPQNRPLGVGEGAPLGDVDTLAFTCASCHFGQLPDGRYSVGAPNHEYEYGDQILALFLPAMSVSPSFDESEHHPDAIATVRPLMDKLAADRGLRLRMLINLLPLLGAAGDQPALTLEQEGHYANWEVGTMDFLMTPLPLDDQVHTISKIIGLWDLPQEKERATFGMEHAMLAWTGGAESLYRFLDGFVAIGDGDLTAWPPERLEPIAEYIYSLRSPAPPTTAPPDRVAAGRALFLERGCIDCHNGPRGSGTQLYTYEEIGTDDAMRSWADPDLDGVACCGLTEDGTVLTHNIKSPRLKGIWGHRRFLHNGSVATLEDVLCLNGPRGSITEPAYGDAGHEYGCDLPASERLSLLDFLRSL